MNDLERSLRKAVAELRSADQSFALVGGLAVSARAEPRLTRDADLVVGVASDDEAEDLVLRLRARGYEVMATLEHEVAGRLATVRLMDSNAPAGMITDLLFASCGIEPEIVAAADELQVLPGFTVPVATVGHLLAMKLLARDDRRRPADADDLVALAEIATDGDWRAAGLAVDLIMERGFNRDRDLRSSLVGLRDRGAY